MKVLVADKISSKAIERLREGGAEVDYMPAISPEDLCQKIAEYDGLIIRSRTRVTKEVLERAENLKIIGRAGIGVDNIDVEAATKRNIVVANAPRGNENAVVEHTLALILSLLRRIPQADAEIKAGRFDKKKYYGRELRGKKVGIVGCGRIGRLVAEMLAAQGVEILGYDIMPYESPVIRFTDLGILLQESDIVTLHVSLGVSSRCLIDRGALVKMKPTAFLVNTSRGGVVDEEALFKFLGEQKIAGAALDVFANESDTEELCDKIHKLQDKGVNIVVTPHTAGQTDEAEEAVGGIIADTVALYLKDGIIRDAVNAPHVEETRFRALEPYRLLSKRLASFLKQYLGGCDGLEIYFEGDFTEGERGVLGRVILRDTLGAGYINAEAVAKEQGVPCQNFFKDARQRKIGIKFSCRTHIAEAVGKIDEDGNPFLVSVDKVDIGAAPLAGTMLVFTNEDVPGVFAKVLTILAEYGLNVARMNSGDSALSNSALAVVNFSKGTVSNETLARILTIREIKGVSKITIV